MDIFKLYLMFFTFFIICSITFANDEINENQYPKDISYEEILSTYNYQSSNSKDKQFSHSLVYVTPWNNKGYDIAKKFNCKFDLVSPVCKDKNLKVSGRHNVDTSWMEEVKLTTNCNTKPKIVPRFRFEGSLQRLTKLSMKGRNRFLQNILQEISEFKFDGIVFDAGYINFRTIYRNDLVDLLVFLSKNLKENNVLFILVIPPITSANPSQNFFNSEDFQSLKEHVDFFSLMTYDFSNPLRPGPSSPTHWSIQSILHLLDQSGDDASKILAGINFYGNDFLLPQGGGPILGDRYIELLSKFKPEIKWDDQNKEHYFFYEDHDGKHIVYYPTLKYIHERIKLFNSVGCGISIWEIGQGLDYFYNLL